MGAGTSCAGPGDGAGLGALGRQSRRRLEEGGIHCARVIRSVMNPTALSFRLRSGHRAVGSKTPTPPLSSWHLASTKKCRCSTGDRSLHGIPTPAQKCIVASNTLHYNDLIVHPI